MDRRLTFCAALLILGQPVLAAAPEPNTGRNRELSEIMFQNYPPRKK